MVFSAIIPHSYANCKYPFTYISQFWSQFSHALVSLTTIEANEILIESGVRREDRKKVIDKIAATLILQSYLGSLK